MSNEGWVNGVWIMEFVYSLMGLYWGFISEKWVGAAEPGDGELSNWSLKKYKRFIDVAGEYRIPYFSRPYPSSHPN
jgi:hypothetical protein